jgi:hypothetical protein
MSFWNPIATSSVTHFLQQGHTSQSIFRVPLLDDQAFKSLSLWDSYYSNHYSVCVCVCKYTGQSDTLKLALLLALLHGCDLVHKKKCKKGRLSLLFRMHSHCG